MDEYIDQLRKTAKAGIPYFTLMGTLALIDICAALNSENGETKGSKFKRWYEKHLSSYHSGSNHATDFDAEDCYKLRCRILHQGRAEMDHGKIDNQVKLLLDLVQERCIRVFRTGSTTSISKFLWKT
jgi:hypothetical protein